LVFLISPSSNIFLIHEDFSIEVRIFLAIGILFLPRVIFTLP